MFSTINRPIFNGIRKSKNSFDIEKCLAQESADVTLRIVKGKNSFDIEKCLAQHARADSNQSAKVRIPLILKSV